MSFDVTRIALQSERETVQSLRHPSLLELDDTKITISVGQVIALDDRFAIQVSSFRVPALVQQQSLLKRTQQSRDPSAGWLEQVHLALYLSLDLLERQPLPAQLAHASELSQRAEVVKRLTGFRRTRHRHDAFFGPAANHTFAESEQLFDFVNGVGRLDPLIVCL